MAVELTKAPPHDKLAEKSVLGAILLENKCFIDVIDVINADDFYQSNNKHIFIAMYNLYKKKQPIDVITLIQEIGQDKIMAVGGPSYLTELTEIPTWRNVKQHSKIIKECSERRGLISSLSKALEDSYECNLLNVVSDLSKSLISGSAKEDKNYTAAQIMEKTIERIQKAYETGGKITGLSTGIARYDKYSNGIKKQEVSIIAARPSMGKTVFTLNLINGLSKQHKVMMFQLEMSVEDIGTRMLAAESFINGLNLQQGKITDKEWNSLGTATNLLSTRQFVLNDEGGLSWDEIEQRIKREKIHNGLDVVFIDHLGLIRVANRNRNNELGEITARAKALAKELDIAVVFLSQLSRACEQRTDKRPMLSDLRDSGNIEQDADLVTFLYRDEYYNRETEDKNIMEAIIAKNRNGLVGNIKLAYLNEFQIVGDLDTIK